VAALRGGRRRAALRPFRKVCLCGNSGHEIRNWVAAYVGPYEVGQRYYRPIPEFIADFAVTTTLSTS
jgi:hypothetical protein